ncbi:amino acid ABC transporter permease [Psychromonas hadalis]|uniref:amino acid ABC transporter permease n=1 Tax=Psychromonas hadalis TaxID=211669 RepID=UPI000402F1C4|nr:ABC transporter permease subunit [Psychromonas hadalis]
MSIIYNKTFRAIFFQFVIVTLLVIGLWFMFTNLYINIEARGIKTGFSFLNERAGFDISESPIAYNANSSFLDSFIVGIANTLYVSIFGIVFSTILGVIIGIARLSKIFLVSKLASTYIEVFRNTPLLLQILFWYNVVLVALPNPKQSIQLGADMILNNRGFSVPRPIMEEGFSFVIIAFFASIALVVYLSKVAKRKFEKTGVNTFLLPWNILILFSIPLLVYVIAGNPLSFDDPVLQGFNYKGGMTYTPEFLALAFSLSIYTATFTAEAVRSGIEAVDIGQKEASSDLGLSAYQSLKLVILPQAIRIALPPIISQCLNVVKNSSLAAAVGYPELVTIFSGTALNQTGQAIEIILMTMSVYLCISLIISLVLNYVNKKLEIKGR